MCDKVKEGNEPKSENKKLFFNHFFFCQILSWQIPMAIDKLITFLASYNLHTFPGEIAGTFSKTDSIKNIVALPIKAKIHVEFSRLKS